MHAGREFSGTKPGSRMQQKIYRTNGACNKDGCRWCALSKRAICGRVHLLAALSQEMAMLELVHAQQKSEP